MEKETTIMMTENFYFSPKKKVFKKSADFRVKSGILEILEIKILNKLKQKLAPHLAPQQFLHHIQFHSLLYCILSQKK